MCDNEQMADVVKLLGGTVTQKLELDDRGGDERRAGVPGDRARAGGRAVHRLRASQGARRRPRERAERRRLRAGEVDAHHRATQLENEVDASFTETHYELVDPDDTSKGYSLQDFGTDAEYDISYTRTELRINVKIAFTGEAPTPAHIAIWENGITGKWNGHYHVENGTRSLPIIFEPIWNSPDEHHEIELHLPPVDREDSSNWYAGPNATRVTTPRTRPMGTPPRMSSATCAGSPTSTT